MNMHSDYVLSKHLPDNVISCNPQSVGKLKYFPVTKNYIESESSFQELLPYKDVFSKNANVIK